MKNINLLILLFLFSCLGYGQTYYVSTNNNLPIDGSICDTATPPSTVNSLGDLVLIDVNGAILSEVDTSSNYNVRPERFEVFAGSCKFPNPGGPGEIVFNLPSYTIIIPLNVNSFYSPQDSESLGSLYFETFNSGENLSVDCETQFISSTNSIINANIIEWEYSINGSISVVTNSQNKRDLPFDFENFDINLNNYIGQSLFFRYRLVGDVYSPFKAYTITKCSPLISSFTSANTSCSNLDNGSFTVTFDRPLVSGETLDFNLRKGSPTGPVFNQLGQFFSGNSYTWPDPLEADNYYLSYQTNPNGSPVNYGLITIQSPPSVTFNASRTDVDCFGENTGSISITAGGGQGNYEYSIDNGANWFPFSSTATHTISNLPATNYQVKVKDSNNCIAQE